MFSLPFSRSFLRLYPVLMLGWSYYFSSASARSPIGPMFGSQFEAKVFGDTLNPGEARWYSAYGFSFARYDIDWWSVETVPGIYNFSLYDNLLQKSLNPNNILPYMVINHWNGIYDHGRSPYTEQGIAAFVNFTLATIHHYQNKGILFEIYNEPNLSTYPNNCSSSTNTAVTTDTRTPVPDLSSPLTSWNPCSNVTAYLNLALAVGKSVKAKYPNELLVGPALGSIFASTEGKQTVDYDFLITLFNSTSTGGILEYYDGISIHFYRTGPPEMNEPDIQRIEKLIQQYTPSTVPSLPFLISGESGYQTGPSPHPYWPLVDLQTQAKYLARMSLFYTGIGINVTTWFTWRNGPNETTIDDDNFGIMYYTYHNETIPFSPKPSAYASVTLSLNTQSLSLVGMRRYPINQTDTSTGNTTVCYVLYWNGGFMTTFYTAWCDSLDDSWTTKLSFPDSLPIEEEFLPDNNSFLSVTNTEKIAFWKQSRYWSSQIHRERPTEEIVPTYDEYRTEQPNVCIDSFNYLGMDQGLVCSTNGIFTVTVSNGPLYIRDSTNGG